MKIINFGLFWHQLFEDNSFVICICYVSFTKLFYEVFRNLATIVFTNMISQ